MKDLVKLNEVENKPKNVEEVFQTWLMKNQSNQGRASATIKEATTWTSKKELMNNLQISSDTIEQIISDLSCRRPADTQNHIKKGGYHNSEVFYDDYLVNMITAVLATEFGVDPKTIQRIVNEQITLNRPVQTTKGEQYERFSKIK